MSTSLTAIDLRTGNAGDIAVVERLMADAFDPRFGEAWTRGQCVGVLGMPGVGLTLAEVDRAPAGFALARAVADEAELRRMRALLDELRQQQLRRPAEHGA